MPGHIATRSMRVAFRYEVSVENPTFSNHYEIAREEVSELSRRRRAPLDSLRPTVASFFWSQRFGLGGEFDRAIQARSAELKASLYEGRVFVIVPIF